MKTTVIKLVLSVEDEDNTTYTTIRTVSDVELVYIMENADKGLNCMIDALKYLPKKKV